MLELTMNWDILEEEMTLPGNALFSVRSTDVKGIPGVMKKE
jgi:hypothetical protein